MTAASATDSQATNALDLGGPEAVTRDVDHVVHASVIQ